MKTILTLATALLLTLALTGTASAGLTCQQVGQFNYCNETGGYNPGGGYNPPGSFTCQTVGQFTYCN